MLIDRRPQPHSDSPTPAALARAVREAARFDRAQFSLSAGLLAAIPVVVLLGGAIAAGDAVAAVTMAAGAMLVGSAWRTGGGRPPLALMAADTAAMACSTFVGCVTGSIAWLHIIVLCLWSLAAGLLVGLGRRGAVIGTQAIIAVVVFGRFSQPAPEALGLAGLVLAGGCAQVLFQSIVRWPPPLRTQRAATAAGYRALSALAAAPAEVSTLPAAAALDDAEATLASATLFADAALMRLRSLVDEGHRIRVALSAIHALLAGQQHAAQAQEGAAPQSAACILEQAAGALRLAAQAIEGNRRADEALAGLTEELSQATAAQPRDGQLSRRIAALAGQLRAVAALAPAAGSSGGLASRRPHGQLHRPLQRIRADLAQLRADASLRSPAGRHAVRLAVVVPLAGLVAHELPLTRGYWIVVAAATVLRPEFGATFTRGTERALGTCIGVALAGAIAVGLHPAGGVTTLIVGLLAWAAYATFAASFAVGFAFITALVVFLLNAVSPDTLATAGARLLDTFVGSAIGLAAYALWPTWSHLPARQALADLVATVRQYIHAVLAAAVEGRRLHDHEMRPLGRRARLARTNAEAVLARSLSEPGGPRIDAEGSEGALGALRRLMLAAHVLRLEGQEDRRRPPAPALAPLAADIDELLSIVQARLGVASQDSAVPAQSLPDLRGSYLAFEHARPGGREDALVAELDEIVDATDGLAVMTGVAWVDGALESHAADCRHVQECHLGN